MGLCISIGCLACFVLLKQLILASQYCLYILPSLNITNIIFLHLGQRDLLSDAFTELVVSVDMTIQG